MANRIYLAFYKHKRSFLKEPFKALADAVTRFFTKGKYSHCEIAIIIALRNEKGSYNCYSTLRTG